MHAASRWLPLLMLLAIGLPRVFAQAPPPALDEARLLERTNTTPGAAVLAKSLGDAAELAARHRPPADTAAWRARRPVVASAVRRALGLDPWPERTPLNARTIGTHRFDGYEVENVLFESRPGFLVTANVYRPLTPGRHPAVLSPVGHFLSQGKTHPDVQARCIQLAKMGCVVLVYDPIGQGERLFPGNVHHAAGYALLPLGDTIAGWMVWDSIRAIDYLATRPDVDIDRLGVTGNSGGGLNTLFTAALDERVKAAAVVGFTFEFRNWILYGGTHCTCTHWPGLLAAAEWFEVAGLIAPRHLLMIQGEDDRVFLNTGARRAAEQTQALYAVVGHAGRARYVELAGQPHAYTRPFREPMYGWFARLLLGAENDRPIAEGPLTPLPERDRRLLCDPDGHLLQKSPNVIDLAKARGLTLAARQRTEVRAWAEKLLAPPPQHPHNLFARTVATTPTDGGKLERLIFHSEDGVPIPALLWLPEKPAGQPRVVVIADDRGKSATAELVSPLLRAGFAVFAPDLRGRGETLGQFGQNWDTNFRLTASQILLGQPLPGRRAFDLRRALDYLGQRKDLDLGNLAVVGSGDDGLSVLLAAAVDERIRRVAVGRYYHSFVAQMAAAAPKAGISASSAWNDPQLNGRVQTGTYEVDFGGVVPGALLAADVPDLFAHLVPRRVLFCEPRDGTMAPPLVERLRTALGTAYRPDRKLTAATLLDWLRQD